MWFPLRLKSYKGQSGGVNESLLPWIYLIIRMFHDILTIEIRFAGPYRVSTSKTESRQE
jgi:hypothetical protein